MDERMTRWINTNQYHGNEGAVVHTKVECMYVSAMSLTEEEANVDFDDLRECDYCAGRIHGREAPQRDCPFCGETTKSLPDHLPCEASP